MELEYPQRVNKAPTAVSSQQLVASLPAGTKCAGGKAGNLCLVVRIRLFQRTKLITNSLSPSSPPLALETVLL